MTCTILIGVVAGCDTGLPSSGSEETISDEAFVETVVALRRGTADDGEARLSESRRDEILAERGVTEEDLFQFVEVHGRNVPRMSAVWTEVEARLTGQDPEALELDDGDEAIPGSEPGEASPEGETTDVLPGGGDAPGS